MFRTHRRTLQNSPSFRSCSSLAALNCVFGSLSRWRTCDMWLPLSFQILGSTFSSRIPWCSSEFTDLRLPAASKQPQNITEPPPWCNAGILFLESFIFVIRERRADVTSQIAPVLTHRSKGTVSRKDCGLSTCILANSSLAFFMFILSKVEASRVFPSGGLWRTVWSETQVPILQFSFCSHAQGGCLQFHGP